MGAGEWLRSQTAAKGNVVNFNLSTSLKKACQVGRRRANICEAPCQFNSMILDCAAAVIEAA